jgi:K+-sensing histidine kinase KdpD
MVRGDPTLLRRMIRNLVENAELHGQPPIEVTVDRRHDRAVLDVRDRGPVIGEAAASGCFTLLPCPERNSARAPGSAWRWSGRSRADTAAT